MVRGSNFRPRDDPRGWQGMSGNRGRRIRQAMARRGVGKHCVLAAALGVTEGAVSRWCQGGQMTLANTVALCEYLDVSADWLLMGRGDMESNRQIGARSGVSPLPEIRDGARHHLALFLQALSDAQ